MDSGLLYGEAQETVLHVAKNEDGEYEIDSEDMKTLDGLLIEDQGGTEE